MFDLEKIEESIKPIDVVRYCEIPYKRVGNRIFILCPDHEKNTGFSDRHIGNCVLNDTFHNAYHCFGCGATGSVYDLIAAFYGYDIKKDFYRVCSVAADSGGGQSFFKIDEKEYEEKVEKKKKEIEPPLFSDEQLDAIGIKPTVFGQLYTECFKSKHNIDISGLSKDYTLSKLNNGMETSFLQVKPITFSLRSIELRDKISYEWYMKQIAFAAMERYKYILLNTLVPSAERLYLGEDIDFCYFASDIETVCKNKYLLAKSVWLVFSTDEEKLALDEEWLYKYK